MKTTIEIICILLFIEALSTSRTTINIDPYEQFVKEQAKREDLWKTEYAQPKKRKRIQQHNDNMPTPSRKIVTKSGDVQLDADLDAVDYKEQLRLKGIVRKSTQKKIQQLEQNAPCLTNITDVSI